MFHREPLLPDPSRFNGHATVATMLRAIASFHHREHTHWVRSVRLSEKRMAAIGRILDALIAFAGGGDFQSAGRQISLACDELMQAEFETSEHLGIVAQSVDEMEGTVLEALKPYG